MTEEGEQLESKLFGKVKYKISGNLPGDVVEILKNGGAEGSNYFSDYHTHCIVGSDPAESDITDAKELYEIPAVTSEWVSLSHKCGKLLPVKPFLYGEEMLFSNVRACLSEVSREDCSTLWGMIKYYGGSCSLKLTPKTTHLIVGKASGAKYELTISRESSDRYVVTPDWVLDSISLKNLAQEALYHPRLLVEPEKEKKIPDLVSSFSTAHITGFADDEIGVKEDVSGAKLSNELLEHLKQSMPWNQQQITTSGPPTPSSSTFPSNSLMNLEIKEEPKMPSQPATPVSVPQSPVKVAPQSKPQTQQLGQQVHPKSQLILQHQQQRLQQMTPTTQIAWRSQVPASQQQIHLQSQPQLQSPQTQQQLQATPAQQQLQVSQTQHLQVPQGQPQLQVSQAQQQQLQVSQAQHLQLQTSQQQLQVSQSQQQSVLVQQQGQLIQHQTQQQQIITTQQPQIIQQQQPNILQQNLIQQAQQPQQQQNIGQQQIINQQTTLLLSPQNQIETQQFITTQQQLIQRPQQSKPAIQQQQFVVREGTPQLQQQFTEKPVQFQWQQQYNQNRQQLVATPQVQPRQIAWMQQPQGTRQLIQMDAQTHAQLQQMDPAQRTLFLQRFQKQRQLALQRQLQAQQQNRGIVEQGGQVQFGVGVVRMNQPQQTTVIQRQMPPGISQLQWIQQQRQNQIRQQGLVQQQPGQQGATLIRAPVGAQSAGQHQRLPVNVIPQNVTQAQQQQPAQQQWQTVDGSGLPQQAVSSSPQQQISPSQQQQQIIIRHQHLQRLQQLQLQKQQQQQQQQPPQPPQTPTPGPQRMPHYVTQVNMMNQANNQPGVLIQQHPAEQLEPSTSTDMFGVSNGAGQGQPQLVNPKTKTALANMLSSRLQSGSVTAGVDGTASGQLRLMTAQHQAASLPPPPPPQPPAHPYQRTTLGSVNAAQSSLTRGSDMSSSVTAAKPAYSAQTAARVAAVLAKSASGTPPANHQHRPQFYGHTPNFKIPSDMFLLGCVFLIMEYDRTGSDVTTWRRIILENGGETELTYSPRVTHILCQTQKHPLVQQGLRDGKRCVTAEWLSDVMLKQQVLPPWLALHFPTPFSDEKPCRNLIICHSGFEGDERVRVKKMIEAVGAKMTSYYTSHNNILVCRRPEGEKYKKAREWGRSVVNVQWLNEVLFGHFSCLQHPENQKYQQFNIGNPFRIDHTLVPHLMGAWKVPIQVTQECYERAKSSGIVGPKRKRPRLTSPTNTQNMFEQENMFPIDSVIPPINHGRPIILLSGSATKAEDERKIYQLGGHVAKSYREATHLVMQKIQRTFKLMCCLSTCKYIVSAKWLSDSFQNERFLDEQAYIIEDQEFETKFNCSIQKVLFNPNRPRLFSGKTFFITPGVTPSRAALAEMVHAAGGLVEKQRKSLKHIQELDPESYIVVTVWNDFHLVSDLIRANVPVYSSEFIMSAILTQKLPYETAYKKSGPKQNKN